MALTPGTRLGPYEIQSPLGAGGMGEVYRARDVRLGRDVALKILPESFARDDERLHRFEQEARAVAALNHSNLLAVFDTGQENGSPFLVSELLEGETLRDLLNRAPTSQRKAIEYGVQIAQGLAAAHDKGIVHRDLKPENIFVTKDGRIKILDFGLAKFASNSGLATSAGATMTGSPTAAGLVMGTAGYMAPEQVRGEPVDPRTDIFAFGAVLYEMLSGQRAFHRDTAAETMTAILKDDPPEFPQAPHLISPALDRIVRRCLEKNPEQRFQSARDLSFALGALSGTDSSAAARAVKTSSKRSWLLAGASAVLILLVAAGAWSMARRAAPMPRMEFSIPLSGEVSHMALSVDGTMLVFVSPAEDSELPMLYVQRVGSTDVRPLPGTEGASYPFWSPDATYIGFFANGKLQKISISGGTPQVLANVIAARGGSWGSHDVIIYSPDSGGALWRVNADGSGARALTDKILAKDEETHRWPMFLPDGDHFLYWGGGFGDVKTDRIGGIFVSSLDARDKRILVHGHSNFGITATQLIYANDAHQLVGIAFDPSTAVVSGSTEILAKSVGYYPSVFWGAFSAARNGTVIFNTSTGASKSILTWMDRAGKQLGQIGEPAVQCNPALSPDGNRIALDLTDSKSQAIETWIERTDGSGLSRFTFDSTEDVVPLWSHDGRTIIYRKNVADGSYLALKKASGLEAEKDLLLVPLTEDVIPNSWSVDDRQILYTRQTPKGPHLETIPASGGKPASFLSGQDHLTNGQISPDGKWAAYTSDESGAWEIYVTTFPGGAGKWQVSRGGGTEPRWRSDGKEIFYLAPGGMLTAVPVSTVDTFSSGTPAPLFQFHGRASISSTDTFSYDVTRDGKRFLVNRYVKPEKIVPLTVILNADTKSTQ
ncbi:MAG TPA: protein kinase [Terriglobales bacterium]|nr:protein kinase [Terriglobales bacterium]